MSLLRPRFLQILSWRYFSSIRESTAAWSFISCSIPLFLLGQITAGISLSLGTIAACLADSGKSLRHRQYDFLLTVLLFFPVSLGVDWLFPHTMLFGGYLAVASFLLLMLSIFSPRYAAIGFATTVLITYTMIMHTDGQPIWLTPALLTTGAIWYAIWQWLLQKALPHREDADLIHDLYQTLGEKLLSHNKPLTRKQSNLNDDFITSARLRSTLAEKLEHVEGRIHQQIADREGNDKLSLIHSFVQQASYIAEQTRLMHFNPAEQFGQDNTAWINSIVTSTDAIVNYLHNVRIENINSLPLPDINFGALRAVSTKNQYPLETSQALAFINKLEKIYCALMKLGATHELEYPIAKPKLSLRKLPANINTNVRLFLCNLNYNSPHFRHALRGCLCLSIGLFLVRFLNLEFGFWTLMTSLFVLRPNLSMTWDRLRNRVAGTVSGLIVVSFLLYLNLPNSVLSLVYCAAAVLFFHTTARVYSVGVFAVTLFVFSGFALNGQADLILLPRLENTLLGVALPVLLVLLMAPGWQKKAFPGQFIQTTNSYKHYLVALADYLATPNVQPSHVNNLLQQCVINDTHLFDHWLKYIGEPKQVKKTTVTILLCCRHSNVMLRLLTQLNAEIDKENSSELVTIIDELNNAIDAFSTLEEQLERDKSDFYNIIANRTDNIAGNITAAEQLTHETNPLIILKVLKRMAKK
ncbi:putative membrane protein YccC [Sinobacterium caligoides]|uniref:Putative membrane protein YccC n=1 Tax=Sinobacterium caligoides TaxID=933926 RepID=A0A3N2DFX7_9GAMM|nr:FUSC family membrane protein [Sinobacterium caligoides]ROR98692.1 putative membrane protein YccC [Sinobacterium caligoides]